MGCVTCNWTVIRICCRWHFSSDKHFMCKLIYDKISHASEWMVPLHVFVTAHSEYTYTQSDSMEWFFFYSNFFFRQMNRTTFSFLPCSSRILHLLLYTHNLILANCFLSLLNQTPATVKHIYWLEMGYFRLCHACVCSCIWLLWWFFP